MNLPTVKPTEYSHRERKTVKFLLMSALVLLFFIPTYGTASHGRGLELETTLFFPWMIAVYMDPHDAFYTGGHLKIIPLWVTLLYGLPSFYAIRRILRLYFSEEKNVRTSLEIAGGAFVQLVLYYVTYLSYEPWFTEERFYLPINTLLVTLMFLGVSFFWYTKAAQASLQDTSSGESSDVEDNLPSSSEEE